MDHVKKGVHEEKRDAELTERERAREGEVQTER